MDAVDGRWAIDDWLEASSITYSLSPLASQKHRLMPLYLFFERFNVELFPRRWPPFAQQADLMMVRQITGAGAGLFLRPFQPDRARAELEPRAPGQRQDAPSAWLPGN